MATEEDLMAALAREIQAAVAETSLEPGPREAESRSKEDEREIRMPLRRAGDHVTPTVPEGVRLARAKTLLLRALRFLWRDQASFNALLIEASNGVVAALDRHRAMIARRLEEATGALSLLTEDSRRRDSAQDARLAHLETLVATGKTSGAGLSDRSPELPASVYAVFEERFRGSISEVTEKQRFYLSFVESLPGPVFDAGCGRGEFLTLLGEKGIAARGVESSEHAVRACRAAGLDVSEGDAIETLSAEPAASLGGVVAFQVVEHWTAAATFRFLAAARRALAPGGILIVETVNTDSLSAMNAFYLDPTHVRPVPPEALEFLCDAAGFREIQIEFRSPLPASEKLEERTANDARLNALLFGPQDYAVIARVPRE